MQVGRDFEAEANNLHGQSLRRLIAASWARESASDGTRQGTCIKASRRHQSIISQISQKQRSMRSIPSGIRVHQCIYPIVSADKEASERPIPSLYPGAFGGHQGSARNPKQLLLASAGMNSLTHASNPEQGCWERLQECFLIYPHAPCMVNAGTFRAVLHRSTC